jgi:hypothetical protein
VRSSYPELAGLPDALYKGAMKPCSGLLALVLVGCGSSSSPMSDAGVDTGVVDMDASGGSDALPEDSGGPMCSISFSGIAHGSGTCALFGPTPDLGTGDIAWTFVGTKGSDSNLHSAAFTWTVAIHGAYDVQSYPLRSLSRATAAISVNAPGGGVVYLTMTSTVQPARGDMTFALTSADGKHGTTDATLLSTTTPSMMAGFHAVF